MVLYSIMLIILVVLRRLFAVERRIWFSVEDIKIDSFKHIFLAYGSFNFYCRLRHVDLQENEKICENGCLSPQPVYANIC